MTRANIEYGVGAGLLLIFVGLLLSSWRQERQLVRDDARREMVAVARQQIEDFYNQHHYYPLTYQAPLLVRYVATQRTSQEALGYYLETGLEHAPGGRGGFDQGEGRKYYYLILPVGNDIVYRVCGGTEMMCQPSK